MMLLPAIELNSGPKHHRKTEFTKRNYGRFFRDNSMEARQRQEVLDLRSKERVRLRRAKAEDRNARRQARLRSIETSLEHDQRKVEALLCVLPPIEPTVAEDHMVVKLQAASRGRRARGDMRRRDEAVGAVQRRLRGRIARKATAERRMAATAVQSKIRAAAARREATELRRQLRRRLAARRVGKFVACQWRRRRRREAERRAAEQRREEEEKRRRRGAAASRLERAARGKLGRLEYRRVRRGVAVVQAAVRKWRAAREQRERRRAAIFAQRRWRGARGRSEARRRREYWSSRRRLQSLDPEEIACVVLRATGLVAYEAEWKRAGVDGALLAWVRDEADLGELGVSVRVHRRRLLHLLTQLRHYGVPADCFVVRKQQNNNNDDDDRKVKVKQQPPPQRRKEARRAPVPQQQARRRNRCRQKTTTPPPSELFEDDFEAQAGREDVKDLFP